MPAAPRSRDGLVARGAVTMVFAATGRSPFGSGTVQAVMWRIMSDEPDLGGVPASLLPVVRQCLDKDPSRRPVARDLLLRLVDPSAQYPNPPEPPATPAYPAYPADMPAATGPAPATVGPTFPSDLPAGPSGPGRTSGRSRRGPILAVGAAAVVAALVIGGVLLLTRPSSPRHAAAGSSGAGHTTSPGTSHSLTPTPATQVVGSGIPAAFAGTWTGVASLVSPANPGFSIKNPICFILVAGGRTAHEVNQDCVNVLALSKVTATVLTFSEPPTASCQAGTVTFTRRGARLAYHWLDVNNLAQNSAVLHKSA